MEELQPISRSCLRATHRAERLHRGVRQGKSRLGAAVPDHDRPHADHDHLSGPLDVRDDDGVRNRAAGLIGVIPTLLAFQQPFASTRWSV